MTWLYSLYWIGILTVSAPIAIHFWRRSPRHERPFSTLMFLTMSPPRVTSRNEIEHWSLLVLRATALALLTWAFTRPIWRTQITEPSTVPDEQILAVVVDTSASMRRDGIWDKLLRDLDAKLAELPLNVLVGLYRFDRQFASIADFREMKSLDLVTRRNLVRSRLSQLKPTWQETRLGSALVKATTVFQDVPQDGKKNITQRILLASDLQSGSEIAVLRGYEWPDDIFIEIWEAHASSESNAGLQVVGRSIEFGDDVLRVRVTNAPDSKKDQFSIRWDAEGSSVISTYVPPGQSRILEPPERPDGVAATSLILHGDDHEFDNRVYVTSMEPDVHTILYSGTELKNDIEGARFYLDRVYSSSERFKVEFQDAHERPPSSNELNVSLIFLVQPTSAIQPFVRQHLENGGTVVVAAPSAESTITCLKMCGQENVTVTEAEISNYAMLAEIDFEHPLFAPFAESQFSDFTGIRFWKHRKLDGLKKKNVRQSEDHLDASRDRPQVLAWFDDGDPAFIEYSVKKGRVLVFAAGWHPSDSLFARSSKFPMLMFRILEYSTEAGPRHGNETVGTPLSWPKTKTLQSRGLGTAVLPDGTRFDDCPVECPFEQSDQPGIYTLSVSDRKELIAVNLAAEESRTTPLTIEQLEAYGLKLQPREKPLEMQRTRDRKRQLQLTEIEQSQKLWQIILIGVIGILLLESVVSARLQFRKRISPMTQQHPS